MIENFKSFQDKIKNKEIETIEKGTRFRMIDRINKDPEHINPNAERFNSWVGREGTLGGDIYMGIYPSLKGEELGDFIRSKDYFSLHARLIFNDGKIIEDVSENIKLASTDGISTSRIKEVKKENNVIVIETKYSTYKLEILGGDGNANTKGDN